MQLWRAVKKKLRQSRGFSLLEALTALAVLSIALSALMNAFTTGLKGVSITERNAAATILARTLLAEATGLQDFRTGTRSGRTGSFQWQIKTTPVDRVITGTAEKPLVWNLVQIAVTVTDNRNRIAELNTLKLGKAGE